MGDTDGTATGDTAGVADTEGATVMVPDAGSAEGGEAGALAAMLPVVAREAMLTLRVSEAPCSALFSETSAGEVAAGGSVVSPRGPFTSAGDGNGGRRRPLRRTASASAASLVRL